MADRTPERTQSHAFAVLRASSKRLLIVDSWGFQDGKSAPEILIQSRSNARTELDLLCQRQPQRQLTIRANVTINEVFQLTRHFADPQGRGGAVFPARWRARHPRPGRYLG